MANRDEVLMAVLECGTMDLSVLDDVGYDLAGIVGDLFDDGIKPTLNAIMDRVFRESVDEMAELVKQELEETLDEQESEHDYEETVWLNEKAMSLRQMNPVEDIEWYCNCLDSGLYFTRNAELYQTYLPDAIKTVEGKTGFSLH